MASNLFIQSFTGCNVAMFHPTCDQAIMQPVYKYSLIYRCKTWQVSNGGTVNEFKTKEDAAAFVSSIKNRWNNPTQ